MKYPRSKFAHALFYDIYLTNWLLPKQRQLPNNLSNHNEDIIIF